MSQEINETLEIHNIRLAIKIGRKGFEAMVKIPSYFLRSSAGISYGEERSVSEYRPLCKGLIAERSQTCC